MSWFLINFLICLFIVTAASPKNTHEKRLRDALFSNYDNTVRPVLNNSEPVFVELGFQLISIVKLDLKHQILVTNAWIPRKWTDPFLVWSPEKYGGIKRLSVPAGQLWMPDVTLVNTMRDRYDNFPPPKAVLHHDGTLMWVPQRQLKTKCLIALHYFPFDQQVCNLTFMSWSHTSEQMTIYPHPATSNIMSDFSPSNMFTVFRAIMYNVGYHYTYDKNSSYSVVQVELGLSRRTLYHFYTVMWPCITISALTLVTFRLSPSSGEKIGLGITLLLVFHVILRTTGAKMPESSDGVPLIAVYLTVVLTMTSLSIVMSVFVLNLHRKGSKRQVPLLARSLFLEKLPILLRMHNADFKTKDPGTRKLAVENLVQNLSAEMGLPSQVDQNDTEKLESNPHFDKGILHALQLLVYKQELDHENAEVANQWKALASVIDRLFFWLFFAITVVISLCFVIIIPISSTREREYAKFRYDIVK